MAPTRVQLLRALKRLRALLEIDGANSFKVNAYVRAVRALGDETLDLPALVGSGQLTTIDGIGKGIAEKVDEFWKEGRIGELEELEAKYPPGLVDMTEIPGFGAKKARAVWEELGVQDIDGLRAACGDGRVADMKGFGRKSAEKILAGLDQMAKHTGRFRIDTAWEAARPIVERLRAMDQVHRAEAAGSLRRWRETAKDIDIVVATDEPKAVIDAFAAHESVERVTGQGDTKASVVLDSGIAADLRCVSDAEFPFTLLYFTGSKEHNTRLRGIARERGLKLNEYGLFPDGKDESLPAADEADIHRHFGLDYIEPELREDMGEIDAAAGGKLPRLVQRSDFRGLPHMHTHYSDGQPAPADYAHWAAENGLEWMGIADHSQAAAYAGGLSPDEVRKQWGEIDRVNAEWKANGVRLLKGIECDILADGSLDYDEELRSGFEFLVASIHSHFNLGEAEQTKRLRAAIDDPATTILGHLTGRLLLRRDGYPVDQKEVLRAAGKAGAAIEINADPNRLDLDWRLVRFAREECGCLLAVSPDAHSMAMLSNTRYGIGAARKGWLDKDALLNCLPAEDFLAFAAKRRG